MVLVGGYFDEGKPQDTNTVLHEQTVTGNRELSTPGDRSPELLKILKYNLQVKSNS